MTAITAQIIALATLLGLRPTTGTRRGGAIEIEVNGTGRNAGFGVIYVGATTGRITRATLTFGNDGPTRHYVGATGTRRMLADYAAHANLYGLTIAA